MIGASWERERKIWRSGKPNYRANMHSFSSCALFSHLYNKQFIIIIMPSQSQSCFDLDQFGKRFGQLSLRTAHTGDERKRPPPLC
jgi:hypothetical protein